MSDAKCLELPLYEHEIFVCVAEAEKEMNESIKNLKSHVGYL